LILPRTEKDRSAEQFVAGVLRYILSAMLIFGYRSKLFLLLSI